MDKIREFFSEKKRDNNFKKAGTGYKLSEDARKADPKPVQGPAPRREPGQAASSAGSAALDRFTDKSKPKSKPRPTPKAATANTSANVTRQSTDEEKLKPDTVEIPLDPLDPDFLKSLEAAPIAMAVFQIKVLNEGQSGQTCLTTLIKYMENIATHPDEAKYRKIRVGNNAFQSRVKACIGADDFFAAVGFETQQLPHEESTAEFYVLPESGDTVLLDVAIATLKSPPQPPVHRQRKLYAPSDKPNAKWDLPAYFFRVTADDVKKAQADLAEKKDKELILRTKAMREKESLSKNYRLTCLRIRLADGAILEGTFRPRETILRVLNFIKYAMVEPVPPFQLHLPSRDTGTTLDERPDELLCDLGLVPKALLTLRWVDEEGMVIPELMELRQSL